MEFILLYFLRILLLAGYVSAKRRQAAFEEQYPPISDADFMALCAPGTDAFVALKVRQVVAESLGVEYERIYPSSRLMHDLGAE